MNLKKKKYIYISQIRKTFLEHSKNIALFVHINHMNVFEFNNLKAYCFKNNISHVFWKLNLLKKITKNNLFLSLLQGPTKIFFFSSIKSMLEFIEYFSLKKKIIPLAVYWKANFYSYDFFFKYIKNLNESLVDVSNVFFQNQLICSLNKNNANLISQFQENFRIIWNTLEFVKNSKK